MKTKKSKCNKCIHKHFSDEYRYFLSKPTPFLDLLTVGLIINALLADVYFVIRIFLLFSRSSLC